MDNCSEMALRPLSTSSFSAQRTAAIPETRYWCNAQRMTGESPSRTLDSGTTLVAIGGTETPAALSAEFRTADEGFI